MCQMDKGVDDQFHLDRSDQYCTFAFQDDQNQDRKKSLHDKNLWGFSNPLHRNTSLFSNVINACEVYKNQRGYKADLTNKIP